MFEQVVLAHRRTALALIGTIGLAGCGSAPSLTEQTFTFTPDRMATIFGDKQVETFGVCAPGMLEQRGARLYLWDEFIRQRDDGGPVDQFAGYEIAVSRGESCHQRVLDTYQAAAWFDLSSLPSAAVVSAELSISRGFGPLDPPRERGTSEQCSVMMAGEATELWGSGIFHINPDNGEGDGFRPFITYRAARPDAGPHRANGTSTLRLDVSNTVSNWVRGVRRNDGFVLTPDPDRTLAIFGDTDEGGFMCDMGITGFELQVTVAVPGP